MIFHSQKGNTFYLVAPITPWSGKLSSVFNYSISNLAQKMKKSLFLYNSFNLNSAF